MSRSESGSTTTSFEHVQNFDGDQRLHSNLTPAYLYRCGVLLGSLLVSVASLVVSVHSFVVVR